MKLLQAFNKKEQTINYKEAMEGWEYSCPICRHIVKVNKAEKCFNHENTEQDDICSSKYASNQDEEISKKYKRGNEEENKVVEKIIIEKEVKKEQVLQTDIKIKIKEESRFTEKQSKAYDMFFDFLNNKEKNMFVLAGYSGTGKTYLISRISKVLNCMEYRFTTATFTGKASSVLRSRGVESDTIHSLMYKPIIDEDTGNIQGWIKNGNLPYDLIFIDEYSMLTEEIINDLLSYNIKICFAGDKFQLPAVGLDSNYLDDKVDIELTEIVRQAEGNPIIKWATHIRNGNFLNVGIKEKTEQGLFMTISSNDNVTINAVKDKVSTIICGTNAVRHGLNLEWRVKNKLPRDLIVGEEIIILKNNKCFGLYNGQTIKVSKLGEIYTDKMGLSCMNIEVEDFGVVKICYDSILNPDFDYNKYLCSNKYKKGKNYIEPLFTNSAIAITSHRAQGSQYESVLVFAKDMDFMMKRNPDKDKGRELWLRSQYTAITRAVKNCIVVI